MYRTASKLGKMLMDSFGKRKQFSTLQTCGTVYVGKLHYLKLHYVEKACSGNTNNSIDLKPCISAKMNIISFLRAF